MKCCALPTTSIARSAPAWTARGRRDDDPSVAFGALLASLALRPLAKPLGFYGEFVIDGLALSIARSLPSAMPPLRGAP
jgi:hypothetical protein